MNELKELKKQVKVYGEYYLAARDCEVEGGYISPDALAAYIAYSTAFDKLEAEQK